MIRGNKYSCNEHEGKLQSGTSGAGLEGALMGLVLAGLGATR
jgi:tetrahydromethanopterin S-methyltransferase subunit F